MHPFVQSLLGGLLIGTSTAGLLLVNGHIAGVSGILYQARPERSGLWRWTFLGGLVAVGLAVRLTGHAAAPALLATGLPWLAVAGLLVGAGTLLANGCTSGHGVCGLSRLSPRSMAATATFMATAAIIVFVVRHTGLLSAWGHP